MRRISWFGIALSIWSLALPLAAQTQQQLQRQLEEIQRKLDSLPTGDPAEPNRHVTEIGASRARLKEEYLPRTVTRIYDVSDMFAVAPSYPAQQPSLTGAEESVFYWTDNQHGLSTRGMSGGGMGGGGMGGGGGFFAVPSSISTQHDTLNQIGGGGGPNGRKVRTSADQLIDVIKSSITPEEWKTARATISMIGGSLVVTATEETQSQMAALLDLFRSRWKSLRTVSIRGYWIWLKEAELLELLADPVQKDSIPPLHGLVKPDEWNKRIQAMETAQPRGYETAITCYNGQTVHTFSGEQKLLISGVSPMLGTSEKSDKIAYEPVLSAINEGAVLQLTPLATRNAKYIILDMHSRVTLASILPQAERPEKFEANDPLIVTTAIERPVVQTQRISTTFRIPVNQTVLAGGMTFGNVPGKSLYFFVRGFVQELRDEDAADVKPALSAPESP